MICNKCICSKCVKERFCRIKDCINCDSGTYTGECPAHKALPDWMDSRQKETYKEICAAFSKIKTGKDFYRIVNEVNENPNYSVDLINCAREQMKIFNSAQFQEVTQP